MAKSKFEYVKRFETEERCLPNCWIVVRVDGKGFHKFSHLHEFEKPNDKRSLELMKCAAQGVMNEFKDICLAYGQSDEFSFIFKKETTLYNRRASKLMTNICSLFASSYVYHWPDYFPNMGLKYPPAFDARVILYPSNQNLRDYLSWRQADCHINNLYNTGFWALVQKGGLTTTQAEERLRTTNAAAKNELLYSDFGINYNKEPELYRKGIILLRKKIEFTTETGCVKLQSAVVSSSCDVIGDKFWNDNPHILKNS